MTEHVQSNVEFLIECDACGLRKSWLDWGGPNCIKLLITLRMRIHFHFNLLLIMDITIFINSCHPKYRHIGWQPVKSGLLTKKKEFFFESQDKEKNLEGSFQKPIRFSDSISIQSGRKYPIVFFSPKMVRSFFVKRYGECGHMPIETKQGTLNACQN